MNGTVRTLWLSISLISRLVSGGFLVPDEWSILVSNLLITTQSIGFSLDANLTTLVVHVHLIDCLVVLLTSANHEKIASGWDGLIDSGNDWPTFVDRQRQQEGILGTAVQKGRHNGKIQSRQSGKWASTTPTTTGTEGWVDYSLKDLELPPGNWKAVSCSIQLL